MENLGQHQNIVIRRIKKGRHGHHGGAWKVAMADFALAMMAFFLVLWVINSSNEQQREAISGYFQDPKAWEEGQRVPSRYVIDLGGSPSQADNIAESQQLDPEKILQAEEIESLSEAIERRRLEQQKAQIEARIDASPTLSPFKNQLLLDITTEGLRLQIVDQVKRPMFAPGSSELEYYTEDILWELAPVLATIDHRLSIAGHTDSSRAQSRDSDEVNWRLSALRADAARRALMEAGVDKTQIAQVIGMGDTAPLKQDDPYDPVNRRISVTLLNKRYDEGVSGRAGTAEAEFVNDEEAAEPDDRKPVINKAGSLLQELRDERESEDNPYDNPPNADEVFW
ncbi:motility protein, MotA family protein [Bacterioplanes sanyensis]|uniref:Motility protein, MotA family protein n=1 Tax=Bacterioplanes sanyensis TaxID=1249553 RepID=A0A222FIS8_9GAMM|nr:flagellar motor protein MotB [Bacterioplanes sanyensis]ASP38888.1 motility protein, MotA family protein [Bacterioplanes sanyensis]